MAITGVGMVTPLGGNVPANWEALLRGESITGHARLPIEADENGSRVGRLATTAAKEAIAHAGWTKANDCSIVVGTSKGPIESWIDAPPPRTSDNVQRAGGPNFGLASVANELASRLGRWSASRMTLSAACASGLHALIRAALMVRNGEADRVLIVAAEASLHPLFLGSFERLGVLAPRGERCRPFDNDRRGFLMSEAAAAVCLERVGLGGARRPMAHVGAAVMGGDAGNLVAGDPSGVTLRRLLQRCAADGPVDLYHAHGTGTVLNDALELAAVERIFADSANRPPAVFSHKGAIGHSLGAAGLVGLVFSIQSHRHGLIPGNVNMRSRMPVENVTLSTDRVVRPVRRSITSAMGFGGAVAAVTLQSPR